MVDLDQPCMRGECILLVLLAILHLGILTRVYCQEMAEDELHLEELAEEELKVEPICGIGGMCGETWTNLVLK
jgi:hypothetical protein